jgi:hypothetical protein
MGIPIDDRGPVASGHDRAMVASEAGQPGLDEHTP